MKTYEITDGYGNVFLKTDREEVVDFLESLGIDDEIQDFIENNPDCYI